MSLVRCCQPSEVLFFLTLHVIFLDLCKRAGNSTRSGLIPRSRLQKHWISFPYQRRSPVSLWGLTCPLPLSVPSFLVPPSLSTVWFSCCFPCRGYYNLFWQRLLQSFLGPPESSQKQSSKMVTYTLYCCSGSEQSCLYVLGFTGFKQPRGNSGFVACELAGFCKILGTKFKSKQMVGRLESGTSWILTLILTLCCFRDEGKADVIWVPEDEPFIDYKCFFHHFFKLS